MKRESISFRLNGELRTVSIDPADRALDVLRGDLGLTGTKNGCEAGECGACTIVVDNNAVNACLTPAMQMDGTEILTVEGLSRTRLGSSLQAAYAENGAVQCGFCTPGMLLSSYALLLKNSDPDDYEIRTALSGNLCRCTGYTAIIAAVRDAARRLRESADSEPYLKQ